MSNIASGSHLINIGGMNRPIPISVQFGKRLKISKRSKKSKKSKRSKRSKRKINRR